MTPLRWIIVLLAAFLLGCGAVGLHHYLARSDRVRADALYVELCAVRDQVILYEYETGKQPERLSDLVPHHLRQDQIEDASGPKFKYQPERRWLEEAKGPAIRGLVTRQMPPRGFDLPAPDRPAEVATFQTREEPKQPAVEPRAVVLIPDPPPAPKDCEPEKPDSPAVKIVPAPKDEPIASRVVQPVEPITPVVDVTGPALLNAKLVIPKGPELPSPPAGAYVFESELFTQTNYGWEVRADPEAAGGAYLHCKEGIANGPAQTRIMVGDFHQRRSNSDVTMLRYHIRVPKTGNYYVYGRMWTTDTHCSNYVCAAFDKGGPYIGGMGNTSPFRWAWSAVRNGDSTGPIALTQGDHFLHLFIHEDGVRVDQFILSPVEVTGATRYKANFIPGDGTAWRNEAGPSVHIHFDYPTMVLSPEWKTQANVVLRRLRNAPEGKPAKFKAVLKNAGANGKDLALCDGELDLAALPEVAFLPIPFDALDVKQLPRREYLLKAELSLPDGRVVACETPLMRPFAYEMFGPGKFLHNDSPGPLDGDGEPKASDTRKWEPFADKSWQMFGVLDFGMHTSGNSLHPMQHASIYARTTVNVPKAGTYLFKMQADDQLILWVDGKEVYRHNETHPVTRTACRVKLHLDAGTHRIRFRVNQLEGRWQAALRIRTEDDDLSEVVGVEPGK
ncbi:MAG TPA: PA14 domain-containing protein [Planctomycetota bacterium]|nr:PA14 domain-containing protein [Planctomycetota bacterium]